MPAADPATANRKSALEEHDERFERLYRELEPGYYDAAFHRGRGVQSFWHRERLRLVAECLPASAARILDYGCGPGTFLGNFLPPGATGVGIDIAEPQIEYARRRYAREGLDFRRADLEGLDVEGGLDAAVGIEVIEHLPPERTQPFLAALRRLLAPGGTLVLVTPNYASAWPLLERAVSRLGPVDYGAQHINRFTEERLMREVGEAGFDLETCRKFFVVAPFVAAFSRRAAERVLEWERQRLPAVGLELLLVARRPPESRASAGGDPAS